MLLDGNPARAQALQVGQQFFLRHAVGIGIDDTSHALAALIAIAALGIVFLGLQVSEYVRTAREFTPRTDPYGSMFFTITGFHGAHVAVGVTLLLWGAWQVGREPHRRTLPVLALYWHFVDVVWLVVFASLYLSVTW